MPAQVGQLRFTESQMRIFKDRYALRDPQDPTKVLEDSPVQMWERVARWGASREKDKALWEAAFYEALEDFKFIPGGRILHAAGSGAQVTAMNCFVIPSPEDSRAGIMKSLTDWVNVQAHGGGVGINMSSLRPRGDVVRTVHGTSSGPVTWMEMFTTATKDVIQQGGSRRGAAMIMLDDSHPDIFEFVTAKKTPGRLEGANLSVAMSDEFMAAVETDGIWDLKWGGKVYRTIQARELWDAVVEGAWSSGEPGCVWVGRYNRERNTFYLPQTEIHCTNPCVPAYTRLHTGFGLQQVRNLHQDGRPLVVTVDRRARGDQAGVEHRPAKPVFMTTDEAEVFRVTTSEGYSIDATEWHVFLVERGGVFEKITLKNLQPGDLIPIQSEEGQFGPEGSYELGVVLGWLTGDGYLSHKGKGQIAAYLPVWPDKEGVLPVLKKSAEALIGGSLKPHAVGSASSGVASVRLAKRVAEYGFQADTNRKTPEVVWCGTRETQRGYLQALYSADGCVWVNRGQCTIALDSNNKNLLTSIQILLANFGVVSRIYQGADAKEEAFTYRTVSGEDRVYGAKAMHRLLMMGDNRDRFMDRIGFLAGSPKTEKYQLWSTARNGSPSRKHEKFLARVESIESIGAMPVYDTTEPETGTVIFNGLVTGQCSEQPLEPWGSCLLGTINVSSFVGRGSIDWAGFTQTVRTAVRFLDNVIDLSFYPMQEFYDHQQRIRRMGLGITGLADALIKLEVPYGQDEGLDVTEDFYRTLAYEAYDASCDLAEERGMFPACQPVDHLRGHLIEHLLEQIRTKILDNGIRNGYLTSQQPSGTQALLANVNSGIEPVFDFNTIRVDRTGEYRPTSEAQQIWAECQQSGKDIPSYFVTANDLTPKQHVDVQAVAQRWIDSAISKTVNAPHDYPVEQVGELYRYAYQEGLRTIAFYRDGSRDKQVLYHGNGWKRHIEMTPQEIEGILLGPIGLAQQEAERTLKENHQHPPTLEPIRIKLPPERASITHRFQIGDQEAYVTVGLYENGQPGEIFVVTSKNGSTTRGLMDGFATAISIALQYGVPLEALVKKFSSAAFEPAGFTDNPALPKASSMLDYIFRWMGSKFLQEGGQNNEPTRNGDLCPECGAGLVHAEGCEHCERCAYTRC